MQIRQLFDPQSSTYSYLLWDASTGEAALIDSVKEQVQRDTQIIRELGLDLRYLLETHIHADHITGAGELRKRFNARAMVHKSSDSKCADQLLEEGNSLVLGSENIKVLYTPGHTNTDISFLIDGAVFTGDTLLIRGSGRTDFQSGNASEAYDSITGKLFTLPDSTIVYPGHDYEGRTVSTIGEEKKYNPRLGEGKTREEYIEIMDNMDLPKPKMIDKAVPGNMECGLS
ncbi:MAG: MBL fold metallo-hydrolase [Gammaproteobacteria bacterium]|nr:MBL fold metallo-hydrolase [Gammaproteobacteria bacterium]